MSSIPDHVCLRSLVHRHEEEDRRIAKEFQEMQQKAKMANGRLRLKQMVSAEEKASSGNFQEMSRTLTLWIQCYSKETLHLNPYSDHSSHDPTIGSKNSSLGQRIRFLKWWRVL